MTALPQEIIPQVSSVQAVLKSHLGGNLRAIHLFGSAVDGGLKPGSDIDLMVSINDPLPEPVRRALMTDLLAHSAWPGSSDTLRALEVTVVALGEIVPWRYPPRREMQFGEWLREDIEAGRFEPALVDHDLAILITKLRRHSSALLGPSAAELFEEVPRSDFRRSLLDTIAQWNEEPDWLGEERNILLALARIWFSASTGDIVSKDVAAAWAAQRLPPTCRSLMERAAAAYLGGGEDEPAWARMPVAETIHFCKGEIERALKRAQ